MSGPVSLTEILGEGWCVTVTHGSVLEALSGMEVDPVDVRQVAWAQAVPGLGSSWSGRQRSVALFGRDIGDGVALVVEVDGWTGWVGAQPDVLTVLSANGGMACSLTKNPNREEVHYAADGAVLTGLDPATFRRWGADPGRFDRALDAAGLPGPDGEGGGDAVLRLSPVQRGVLALQVMTGVELRPQMFDGSWLAGPSTL